MTGTGGWCLGLWCGGLAPEVGLGLGGALTAEQQQRGAGNGDESEELLHGVVASYGEMEW